MDTGPALPLVVEVAELTIPVAAADVPASMVKEAAVSFTAPPFPGELEAVRICPPFNSIVAPLVATDTWPELPLVGDRAELEIPVNVVDIAPSMVREPAERLTSPPFPADAVAARISPPSDIVVAPVVVTDTWPELPALVFRAELEIPVKSVDRPRSMLREPAVTVTSPEAPGPLVVDRITPPLDRLVAPLVVIDTWPEFPVGTVVRPRTEELTIPVRPVAVPPSMFSEVAVRLTSPAFPELDVVVPMPPPLRMSAEPPTVTDTGPALPLEPNLAILNIPVVSPDASASMVSEPVLRLTAPASAEAKVSDAI